MESDWILAKFARDLHAFARKIFKIVPNYSIFDAILLPFLGQTKHVFLPYNLNIQEENMAINKTKNGSYCFSVQYTHPESKKKHRKYQAGFKTKKEAKDAEVLFIHSVQSIQKETMIFKTLSNDYMQHRKAYIKELSFRNNLRILNKYILPFFEKKDVEKITKLHVREWTDYLVTINKSPKYKNDIIELFKAIIKHGRLYFDVFNDPTVIIKKFPNPKKRVMEDQVWSIEEFNQFIQGFDSNDTRERVFKLFFLTLYFTGARRGEVKALQFSDINFAKGTLSITKSASNKETGKRNVINLPKTQHSVRVIPLDPILLKLMEEYMMERQKDSNFRRNDFIFIRSYDDKIPLADTTIENFKNRICKKTGVRVIRIHDIRHSHATMLVSSGVNIEVVSKRLGHANIDMTLNVYTHVMPIAEQHSINILEKLHSKINY